MVLCSEIMRASPAIRNGIRTHNIEAIYQAIQTSSKEGMITMDQALFDKIMNRQIRYSVAYPHIRHASTHQRIQDAQGSVTATSNKPLKRHDDPSETKVEYFNGLEPPKMRPRVSSLRMKPMENNS